MCVVECYRLSRSRCCCFALPCAGGLTPPPPVHRLPLAFLRRLDSLPNFRNDQGALNPLVTSSVFISKTIPRTDCKSTSSSTIHKEGQAQRESSRRLGRAAAPTLSYTRPRLWIQR